MRRNGVRVAIIGAGYAGLAAAVALADEGIPVEVFEASRTLGGRARSVDIEGVRLDNGQHILLGAYRQTLALMDRVGADPAASLLRHPLCLEYPGRLRLVAPRLPAPLHLAAALFCARGLSPAEKFAALRFMQTLKACRYRLTEDLPVAELLRRHRQPEALCRYLWEPLCVAALNTPVAEASAQVFLNVLRDSLGAERAASDLLLPRADFSALLPEPAARYVEARGGRLERERRIHGLTRSDKGWRLDQQGSYSHVVIATAPYHARRLIEGWPELLPLAAQLDALDQEPIVTAYLQYPETVRLPFPMVGHAGDYLQWLFDRGALGGPAGLLAAVISARGRHQDLAPEILARRLHEEIASILPDLPEPRWHKVIVEKRATFSCRPKLKRPENLTSLPGLLLAGDYTAGDYPATLEGAVRSGQQAARLVLG
ncbi:hydroxysqualene dehydroxylase HpnE [Denitratisoma oestradiolicum]|uniref:Amine oxidase domain-containing protein n=1 Tax=Denitratisoma oestradiolicum TaxID=311182 RepID=A0A6S6Y7P6_9PROT|nr:hydroxysqualene dehydroxylase HpnE [Denitratisoma oestradiolicum]TWO81286.1 hypothetical protein CBW56_03980 [Denitratisoma oestradiolicum]CAB1368468.1 conserved protein of unknown function [Denitratisoma oestradiolicum]